MRRHLDVGLVHEEQVVAVHGGQLGLPRRRGGGRGRGRRRAGGRVVVERLGAAEAADLLRPRGAVLFHRVGGARRAPRQPELGQHFPGARDGHLGEVGQDEQGGREHLLHRQVRHAHGHLQQRHAVLLPELRVAPAAAGLGERQRLALVGALRVAFHREVVEVQVARDLPPREPALAQVVLHALPDLAAIGAAAPPDVQHASVQLLARHRRDGRPARARCHAPAGSAVGGAGGAVGAIGAAPTSTGACHGPT